MATKLALRVNAANPNHHLWNNNGTFWCHLTVHLADFTKQRLRLSLGTDDVQQARRRRDELFARLDGGAGSELRDFPNCSSRLYPQLHPHYEPENGRGCGANTRGSLGQ